MDIRLVNDGQNQAGGVTAANVVPLTRRNALAVVQVNSSGDMVNPGGGTTQDGAILDGVSSSIKATVLNDATAFPSASDKALTVQLASQLTREVGKVMIAGSTAPIGVTGDVNVTVEIGDVLTVGRITAPVGVSGDVSTIPKAGQTWPISVAADLNVREQQKIGAHVSGGQTGVTGDVTVIQGTATNLKSQAECYQGGAAVAAGNPLQVSLANTGANTNKLLVTPDLPTGAATAANQTTGNGSLSTIAGAVTGTEMQVDVLTMPTTTVQATDLDVRDLTTADKITVGQVTVSVGVSGDVSAKIGDGADSSIKATVRDYANSNPIAVALTNASGDTVNPHIKAPNLETKAGIASWTGSYVLASAAAGKRLCVTSYDLQAQADQGYSHFARGASGSPLTPQWILGIREGVAKQVPQFGDSYLFRTEPGGNLSFENAGNNVRFAVSYFSGDA